MTEAVFYHLLRKPLEKALPELLEKSYERGWRVVVQAASEERVDALDAHLWTYRDDSFLPHGTAREGEAAAQPILITSGDHNPNGATVRRHGQTLGPGLFAINCQFVKPLLHNRQ